MVVGSKMELWRNWHTHRLGRGAIPGTRPDNPSDWCRFEPCQLHLSSPSGGGDDT